MLLLLSLMIVSNGKKDVNERKLTGVFQGKRNKLMTHDIARAQETEAIMSSMHVWVCVGVHHNCGK